MRTVPERLCRTAILPRLPLVCIMSQHRIAQSVVFCRTARARWDQLPGNVRGALWLLLSALAFAMMGGIAKMLGGKLHAFEIAFFRCLFGLAAILPFLWGPNGASLKTSRPWLYLLRCLIGITAILGSFYSLANLPLAASVAVNFTKPLFMLVLAALFLGEKVDLRRGLATCIGFIGVIAVVRPSPGMIGSMAGGLGNDWLGGTAAAVYAAFAMAVVLVLIKKLSETEQPATLLFWFTLASAIGTALPAALVWQTPTFGQLLWLILLGVLASLGQFGIFRAYQVGEATVVGPVDYTQLIWAGGIGILCFNEIPDLWTILGAALIVASAFVVLKQRKVEEAVLEQE